MDDERALRDQLGIPADARQVIVFAETSHWDPNWLYTSEEYYERFVQKQLDQAIDGLQREPRRVYSVECVFFLRMYWERNPGQQAAIRDLVNEGRLRLSSSGVTTADTLLPSPEAILRDFLLGQEWLRQQGMLQEPRLAYFSDSFGCSPALPSLLAAAGFRRTAITRVDGMYFPGFERNNPRKYPRPGSTAERLMKEEGTLDFVWRDRGGGEVLCHWNAFSYGQGDLLAHRGFSRIYLFPLAIPDRSERNVARRIRRFVGQLEPYSRTPYLFCPIGFDFVPPIPNLVGLLDRYNQKRYPDTGVWALNAGLDDYLELVNVYRHQLPVLELDPNPYWTGFYSARPALKERCHALVDELLLAEALSHLPENVEVARTLPKDLAEAWWTAAIANHHDFITGTSPDRIVDEEQVPWLEGALEASSQKLEQLTPQVEAAPVIEGGGPPPWSRHDGRLRVETAHYALVLDEAAGGAIVEARDPDSEAVWLAGPSNDLLSYKDSGGLWRMGYEFAGGIWRERARASQERAELAVSEEAGGLQVSWRSDLDGELMERAMWFEADSPLIYFCLRGRAPKRRTVTVTLSTGLLAPGFLMDMPGGVVFRAHEKIYSPTFWPFQRFLHIQAGDDGRGLAFYQNLPGAASLATDGTLQVVALRNAPRERAYHVLPVSGNPAWGYERDTFVFVYALEFLPGGDWIENGLPEKAHAVRRNPWADPALTALRRQAAGQVEIDRDDVWLAADKPASRGAGRIVRLSTLSAVGQAITLASPGWQIQEAYLCDARERDIRPLEVRGGLVHLTVPGTIASVRLIGTPAQAGGEQGQA